MCLPLDACILREYLQMKTTFKTSLVIYLPPENEVWGKVIFLHLSVILFTGGVPGQVHPLGRYTLLAGTPPGRYIPRQCMLGYGQQAGGTHPTGMHSCFGIVADDLTFSVIVFNCIQLTFS